jgi:hypothetical protein
LGQLSLPAAAGEPRIDRVLGSGTYARIVVLTTALCALPALAAQAPMAAGSTVLTNVLPAATASSLLASSSPRPPAHAPVYPSAKRVGAAERYIAHRAGRKAFAVDDDRDDVKGFEIHSRFHSASCVKSMLLVAYLRMVAREHRPLDDDDRAVLYPMIHSSDNDAATDALEDVGEDALNRVARDAHMTNYVPGGGTWGFTEVSAADLARFFYHQDKLIPRRFDGYARWLLSGIEAGESWGIPAVARPEFSVFFKGGWLPEIEGLVNQAARLERPGIKLALAVLSTHDPSMEYGEQTIEGVTARLLGRAR